MGERKLSIRGYVLLGGIVLLFVAIVLIIQRLFTADYPMHSDVFYMGVEAGALAVLFLVCLSLMGLFSYHLATLMYGQG